MAAKYARFVYESIAAADAAAAFPDAVWEGQLELDRRADHSVISESVTLPASPPANRKLRIPLPRNLTELEVTVDAAARTVVSGSSPGTGQVGLDWLTGTLTFTAGDWVSGAVIAYEVRPVMTLVTASDLWVRDAELRAAQTRLDEIGGDVVSGPASATDNAVARFDGTTGKLIQTSGAILNDAGVISATGATFANPLAVDYGGTGATTAAGARTALDLEPGVDVQGYSAQLAAIASRTATDGGVLVGDGSTWVVETGNTLRASIGCQAASTNLSTVSMGSIAAGRFLVTTGSGDSLEWQTASSARTALGLGTIATQDANSVAITGGAVTGLSELDSAETLWTSLSPVTGSASGFTFNFINGYWETTASSKYLLYPVNLPPGSVITKVRYKFKREGANAGVTVRLRKRIDGSGTDTNATNVQAFSTATGSDGAVTVQTNTLSSAETLVEGTTYYIDVYVFQTGGSFTRVTIYGVQIETTKRVV